MTSGNRDDSFFTVTVSFVFHFHFTFHHLFCFPLLLILPSFFYLQLAFLMYWCMKCLADVLVILAATVALIAFAGEDELSL